MKDKSCPECGGTMSVRLGQYECLDCGHAETAKPAAEEERSGPGFRREQWGHRASQSGESPWADARDVTRTHQEQAAVAPPPAPAPARAPLKYDPAPTLGTEKLLLIGIFVIKAAVNVAVAARSGPIDAGSQAVSPIAAQLLVELISVGLMGLVIYLPVIPLKWCCATYTCFVALLSLAGLILSAVLTPLVGLFIPLGGLSNFAAWTLGLLNVGVQLWLASVLYRDIQKLQAG